jgi:MFS family permease
MLGKLMKAFTADPQLAATLASNISLLGAGLLLNELVRTDFAELKVRRAAVLFIMFSPASAFLSSAFPESTFLMLSIGALLAATQKRWFIACLLGMATSATEPVGVVVLAPLLVEFLNQSFRERRSIRAAVDRRFFLLALVPCGALLFMLYGYVRLHQPFLSVLNNLSIGGTITSPVNAAAYARDYDPRYGLVFVGFVATTVLLLGAGIWLRLRPAFLTYGLLLVVAFVCFGTLDATPRHFGIVFPLFVIMGVIAARLNWLYEGMLAMSVGLLTLWTVLFANGQYVV